MKKNITLRANELTSNSRLFLVFLFFSLLSPALIQGQGVKKSITKEIPVSENAVIKIQGPQSVRITGNGAINTRQIKDQYIVSGKSSKPYIYVIHKKMQIKSWEKDSLKQVVNIVLDCKEKTDIEKLLDAFEVELEENAAESILVNCELNIAKFKVENGWFSAEDNHVILKDGKKYPVKYLELSTVLYVPKKNRIALETNDTDVAMNSHQGTLDLKMSGGSFIAKTLGETKAEFNSVQVDIAELQTGTLKVKDCTLNLGTVNELIVKSSISKFHIREIEILEIEESLSDDITIRSLGKITVSKSRFTNYNINKAKESLDITTRNGDIRVLALDADLKFVNIINQHAKVNLGVQNLQSYQVNCKSINQSKYKLPQKMKVVQKSETEKTYHIGPNPEQTKIDIDCSQCDVNLEHFSS